MNLKFHLPLKNLLLSTETLRHLRRVAGRFALHETGALLCACAPLVYHAGEKLQQLSEPSSPMPKRASLFPDEEHSSFDF